MSISDRIESLKQEIRIVQGKGQSINPEALLDALESISVQASPDRDFLLANHAYELDYARETSLEMFRTVITTGQSALKATMLLNGGAAVAMLAFVGKLVEYKTAFTAQIGFAVLMFAFGALASVAATGGTYLSQLLYASSNSWAKKIAIGLHITSIVLVAGSLMLFGYGAWLTSSGVDLLIPEIAG